MGEQIIVTSVVQFNEQLSADVALQYDLGFSGGSRREDSRVDIKVHSQIWRGQPQRMLAGQTMKVSWNIMKHCLQFRYLDQ